MSRRKSLKGRRERWKRGTSKAGLGSELYKDPEFRALAAKLRLAAEGLDHPEAAKWLLDLGRTASKPSRSRRVG